MTTKTERGVLLPLSTRGGLLLLSTRYPPDRIYS